MSSYYNEIDREKAAWIRELMKAGMVAPGEVDERSILDVRADDLRGYTQCHFFAGIGVWSYALRLAGWEDSRPCWTGSCPCPSFSVAGKGEGFDDPRHLWPIWFNLIRECRPGTVFGEQADGAIGHGWLDLVSGNLEAEEYAFASAVLGAHSVGAPHRRQRLYFVGAHAKHAQRWTEQQEHGDAYGRDGLGRSGDTGGGPNPNGWHPSAEREQCSGEQRLLAEHCGTGERIDPRRDESCAQRENARDYSAAAIGEMRSDHDASLSVGASPALDRDLTLSTGLEGHIGDERDGNRPGWLDPVTARSVAAAGATRGFWADCDWWYGRDGKFRPIEPGLFPLAHGATCRVGRLRGYGDAIVAQAAAAFIECAKGAIG